jgi:hypothetical protein
METVGAWLGCGQCSGNEDETQITKVRKSSERSCTDVFWLALFFAFWGFMWVLWSTALASGGDVSRITNGVDYAGNVCGKGDNAERPLVAWPDPTEFDFRICVASCAETTVPSPHPLMVTLTGATDPGYTTEKFINYCVPDPLSSPNIPNSIFGADAKFGSGSQIVSRYVADFSNASDVIIASGFIAFLLSCVYASLLKRFALPLVFFAIVAVCFGTFLAGYSMLSMANDLAADPTADSSARADTLKIVAGCLIALAAIFVLVMIAMWRRILIAAEVVKEASRALGELKNMLVFAGGVLAVFALYFIWWVYGALFFYSAGAFIQESTPASIRALPNAPATFSRLDDPKWLHDALWAHFFGLLWSMQFLMYVTFAVLAGAIASWYFSLKDEDGKAIRGDGENELSNSPILDSTKRTFRFHLGTIAFGSLIIATVQFIRSIVAYIEQSSREQTNKCQKALFCAVQCCLKCVQYCLDKLSKNAFVFTAIYGHAFCPAGFASFGLLWRNLARVAAISVVTEYLMVLGKVLVAVVTTGIANYVLSLDQYSANISSTFFPTIAVFLLSYTIASLFMVVFDTTVDTTFMCFLVDEENNKESGNMFASPGLIDLVDKYDAQSAEKAKKMGKKLVDDEEED